MSTNDAELPQSTSRLPAFGRVGGLVLFLVLLLAPGLPLDPVQRRVAAVTALTAVWWTTGALPIGITSLLPAGLFPVLGVMTSKDVAPLYMNHLVLLFLGAFVIALGLERWNVHRRFALWTIARVGTSPRRLVLGFMLASAFLSLWIKNTSTVLLMLPIGVAVVNSVTRPGDPGRGPFAVSLLLGMAYSASVGGIATPVGTAPNQVFLGQMESLFPELPAITFGQWLVAFLPLVLLYLPLGWLILTRVALRVPREGSRGADAIAAERSALGGMARGEKLMTAVFALTALLWVTRGDLDLGAFVIPGWGARVLPADVANPGAFIHEATIGTLMAILCFLVPVDRKRGVYLMDWQTASRLPWEVLLLIGGGFAIAGGFQASGLDQVLGSALGTLFVGTPEWLIVAIVVLVMAALTEVTSNTATTVVLLPVLGSAAMEAGLSPLLTMLPATVAASAAFMLPVATPPNAVVFSSRLVPAATMARVGLWMNLLMVVLVTCVFQLWVRRVLSIDGG